MSPPWAGTMVVRLMEKGNLADKNYDDDNDRDNDSNSESDSESDSESKSETQAVVMVTLVTVMSPRPYTSKMLPGWRRRQLDRAWRG